MHQRGGKDDDDDALKLPPIDSKMYLFAQPTPSPPRPSVITEYLQPKVKCEIMYDLIVAVEIARWDFLDLCAKSNKPVFVFVLLFTLPKGNIQTREFDQGVHLDASSRCHCWRHQSCRSSEHIAPKLKCFANVLDCDEKECGAWETYLRFISAVDHP